MAIRKPTAPAEKSAVFAEFLAGAGMDNTVFTPGSIVEGTVSAVKGDDVFVDIGYKSEGIVGIDEFADPAEVKPGLKFSVMLRELENEKTGMVNLSKKAADDQIRWEKVQSQYTEGCVVTGTIRSVVRGGLLVSEIPMFGMKVAKGHRLLDTKRIVFLCLAVAAAVFTLVFRLNWSLFILLTFSAYLLENLFIAFLALFHK